MMEFEYWWLLAFPLFFGLGWIAARIDIRHLVHESRALPRSYFKGLNFLLNEQPDKAIEAFIEVVRSIRRRSTCTSRSGASFACAASTTARSECTRTSSSATTSPRSRS